MKIQTLNNLTFMVMCVHVDRKSKKEIVTFSEVCACGKNNIKDTVKLRRMTDLEALCIILLSLTDLSSN